MLPPAELNAVLNKVVVRYQRFKTIFDEFAEDVSEFFARYKGGPPLSFSLQLDRDRFAVSFADKTFEFVLQMNNTSQASIIVLDVSNPDVSIKKAECVFDANGNTSLKTHENDDASIGDQGRHIFSHLLHEATKEMHV